MTKLGDMRVEEMVMNALRSDSRIDLSEIQVRVEDGIVYLSGTVDSAAEKLAAREDLQATLGTDHVVDDLQLRNYIYRSDSELREVVKRALLRDISVDAGPISVEVNSGIVALAGYVASYAQKLAAENVAWWAPGVTNVINNLNVDGIAEPPDEPDY